MQLATIEFSKKADNQLGNSPCSWCPVLVASIDPVSWSGTPGPDQPPGGRADQTADEMQVLHREGQRGEGDGDAGHTHI